MGVFIFLLGVVFYIYGLVSLFMSGSYFLFALVLVFGGFVIGILGSIVGHE